MSLLPDAPAAAGDVSPLDEWAMRCALDQAHNAALVGEVPVGAVVMRGSQVVATGYNRPITSHDPTAHAEIVALRHAAQLLGNYRLPECVVIVTLEPCAMCAMALLHARVKRVVFGAHDPKTGAAGSVIDLFGERRLNHHTQLRGGVLAGDCGAMLRQFFAERREWYRRRRSALAAAPASPDEQDNTPSIPTGEAVELLDGQPPH
jgi:tRNA(adenine34) deaminase